MSTADLSEFDALTPSKRKPCPLGAALEELDGQQAVNLLAALDAGNERVPARTIIKWGAARGFVFKQNHVCRHRAGTCSCHGDA